MKGRLTSLVRATVGLSAILSTSAVLPTPAVAAADCQSKAVYRCVNNQEWAITTYGSIDACVEGERAMCPPPPTDPFDPPFCPLNDRNCFD